MERLRQALRAAVALQPPERPAGVTTTPAAVNVRTPVTVFPHRAPDPAPTPPSRPARVQIVTFRHFAKPWEDRFSTVTIGPPPRAAIPRGHMNPWGQRANIHNPPHVAYGSLFTTGGDR